MPPWRAASLAALAMTAACAARPQAGTGFGQATIGDDAAAARSVAQAFLELEAQGDSSADSLLAPGADFLMTGVRVVSRPRVAGVNGPGQAFVEEASTGAAGAIAWVVFGYRFTARTPALNERARGTFILEKQRAGWRIRHVHTSMVERWER